jgi:ubiquinone/menaquinone biosynthesis C-methylase UbiE
MVETTADDDSKSGNSTAASADSTDVLAGHARHTIADVRDTYREQAATLGRVEWLNRLLTRRYRRPLFQQARGRVLDVACGLATNAQYVPDSTEYVGIDVSVDVLKQAEQHADELWLGQQLREMDAQDLAFSDDSFDTVISSLSTCTFPDPIAALSEMGRVCAPDGQILLLEHGRSSVGPVARFQDWRADAHFEKHSCRWNQEPLAVVAESPLRVVESSSALLGVITAIEARPA